MFLLIYCLHKTKNNQKCFTSRKVFKQKLCFEKYLLMPNSRERVLLTKYIDVQIVHISIYKHIYLYDSDICTLCNLNSKGDEYHYI